MNVVLIHPYIKVRHVEGYMFEPLGLLCLASWLDAVFEDAIDVSILDLFALGSMVPENRGELLCQGVDDPDFIANELKKIQTAFNRHILQSYGLCTGRFGAC